MQGTKVKKSNFASFVRKIKLTPNTLIVFDKNAVTEQGLNDLADVISKTGISNVVLMTVENVKDIAALPESEMNKHGWFRAPALMKAIRRGDSEKTATVTGNDSKQT